ncbi:MAG: LPS-assembly protein LptD, partial [Neisseriaceae bacterium]
SAWGYITPKFGYHYTHYSLDPYSGFYPGGGTVVRQLPITSVDSGLYFDREVTWFNSSFVQTLEPRLYYLYIPQTNQANLPVFDTAVATPSLNQLFSENRFSGYDRINSANDITVGLTSRVLNDNTGTELANWGAGYRYYLTPYNNLIYGSYNQFGQLYQPTPNFVTELSNNWAHNISTAATFQYDSLFNNVDGYSLQFKYNPEQHKVLNVKYSYQYQMPIFFYAWVPGQQFQPIATENQHAIDISGQWPLFSNKWLLDGRMNYDLTSGQILNALGGLEYNGGCWSLALVYEQFTTGAAVPAGAYNTYNAYTSAYYVQFTLRGLTNIGTGDPTSDLKMNIPGYAPVTTLVH